MATFASVMDPREFAQDLTSRVIPSLLRGDNAQPLTQSAAQRLARVRQEDTPMFLANPPEQHQDILFRVAESLLPPSSLIGANEAAIVTLGGVAFRAASRELLQRASVEERYRIAAGWWCENFGSWMWWNCD
jgi:hypothetical protein